MNILLLAENWPPRIGGIEKYLTNIAKGLQELPGNKVTVIAPAIISKNASRLPIIRPQTAGDSEAHAQGADRLNWRADYNIQVTRRRFFWPFMKPKWLPLFVYLYRLASREKIDVVLCGKALFEGLIGYYLKKYLNIPYIVFTYAMEIAEWEKSLAAKKKLVRVLKNADKIVCINELTRKQLLKLGANERHLGKIYPGVEEKYFNAKASTDIQEKYSVNQPYIISVGRLIPRKGFDNLIEAYSMLDQTKYSDVNLVIIGDGPEHERLEALAQKLYVQPKFLGPVPDEDLPALYAGAELFALTPKEIARDIEGFGIVYLEANAAGIPVIGTRTGGVPEAVEHNKTGLLVESENPKSIKDACEQLLANKNKTRSLGISGRERARHEFTWPKQIYRLGKMLQDRRV